MIAAERKAQLEAQVLIPMTIELDELPLRSR